MNSRLYERYAWIRISCPADVIICEDQSSLGQAFVSVYLTSCFTALLRRASVSASPSCPDSGADLMPSHFKAPLSLVGDASSLRGSASARRHDLCDALDYPRSLTNYYLSADSIAAI